MSLTIGNVQKFDALTVKHYWCHGIITATPNSAPIDRFVIAAAKDQLRFAGLPVTEPRGPWSSFGLTQYQTAYHLVEQAATSCGLTAAEWELYVFQPGNGANALLPGAALPPLAQAKAQFLIVNDRAANPGATRQSVDAHARIGARSAAFLMKARPYNMLKSQIEGRYPGAFTAFKNACEVEALRVAQNVATNPARTRAWYELQFSTFLGSAQRAFPFV